VKKKEPQRRPWNCSLRHCRNREPERCSCEVRRQEADEGENDQQLEVIGDQHTAEAAEEYVRVADENDRDQDDDKLHLAEWNEKVEEDPQHRELGRKHGEVEGDGDGIEEKKSGAATFR